MRLINADEIPYVEAVDGDTFERTGKLYASKKDIDSMPAIEERKTGKWINANEGKWNTIEVLKCSVCGEIDNRMYRTDNFCPNCGTDMREQL